MKYNSELKFVRLCACVHPDSKTREEITSKAYSGLDWDLMYEIALRQKVYPLLYQTLKSVVPDKVPNGLLNRLKQNYIANAARNIQMTSFLIYVLNLFKTHGIVGLPFKGPVLAQEIYGSIDLRQFSDLDILVSKKDSLKAWALLIAEGFEPEFKLTPKQRAKYIKTEDNLSFFKNKIPIELHWEISGLYLSRPLVFQDMEERFLKTSVYDTEVPTLAMEDLLVYLCIHGSKHGWESLEQVCCVAELLKRYEDIDWSFVEHLALKWRCKRMLYLGLCLAESLLYAPIPSTMMERINKDREIIRMRDSVCSAMGRQVSNSKEKNFSDRFSFFHMGIRDAFPDKLRYGLRIAFCPTNKEWHYFPVPAVLSALHYGLRPLRLIIQGIVKSDA